MATVTSILAKIDAKIDAVLDNPDQIASYRLGEKSVQKNQILSELLKAREVYQKLAETEPYEDIRHVALDWSDFGEEISELVGARVV